jgi:hypothetical protein
MVEVEIPSLDTLLNIQYPHYAYDVSFEESRDRPLITVHTSGSAGFPKPIVITHGWAASLAEELYLKAPEGYESTTKFLLGTKLFSQFPFFHVRVYHLLKFLMLINLDGICHGKCTVSSVN